MKIPESKQPIHVKVKDMFLFIGILFGLCGCILRTFGVTFVTITILTCVRIKHVGWDSNPYCYRILIVSYQFR